MNITVNVCVMDGKLFKGCVIAYDFHFNIATISIETDVALPTAIIRPLDDSISIDPSEIACTGDKEMTSKSFQLHCHSNLFRLCPGDMVVAIGRSCTGTRELMAAPGKFSLDYCEFDCKELFRANCIISKLGHEKGSPAEQAGILHSDVVVQCGKKVVESFLEFYDIIWKKVGKTVKVVVVRESSPTHLNLEVFIDDNSPDKTNRWPPVPETYQILVGRVRFR